jgi:methionyl-tRNA formyltransferase
MAFRLAFMGSPDFSIPALQALALAGHEIAAVYCQPPRPAGRGQKERPCPVETAARKMGFPVRSPKSLRDEEAQADFAALDLDIAVVAAYGLILPKEILEAPRLGCINIHASLLPRCRGAAPIQRAILAGDSETGITIMQMDEGLDTGAMLLSGRVAIKPETTGESLHDALSAMGAALIVEALERLEAGTLEATPQPDDGATYAKKLDRAESRLDWTEPAAQLERQIRAFTPWPGSFFEYDDERIKVLDAAAETGGSGKPGTVIDDRLGIACGDGVFRPLRLQRPGRKPMPAGDFLRGSAIPKGTVLP